MRRFCRGYQTIRVQPIAIQLGPLAVHWYGVLAALGFYAGLFTAARRARKSGVSDEDVWAMGTWLVVGALVGARIWYVVSYWKEEFAQRPILEAFMIHHGGLVFYGGLVGAFFSCYLFVRQHRLPPWKVADIMAPSILLGHAFGRVGCLMHGCCFGHACELPWAIHFPLTHETRGAGVHPTQLYEAGLNLLVSTLLALWYPRRRFDGQIFGAYLCAYAVLRSFVEMFRGDYAVRYVGGALTPAHLVSLVILGLGLVLLAVRSRSPLAMENQTRAEPSKPS